MMWLVGFICVILIMGMGVALFMLGITLVDSAKASDWVFGLVAVCSFLMTIVTPFSFAGLVFWKLLAQ